jgi:hypothetical protein
MDGLFGGSNHVEKGSNLLHIEDAHHAQVNENPTKEGPKDDIIPANHFMR